MTPEVSRRRTVLHAVAFAVGISLVFTALGASMGLIGALIPTTLLFKIAGSALVVFGLWLLLARRVTWLNYEVRLRRSFGDGPSYLRSVGLGAILALGLPACAGPLMGSALFMAWTAQTAWQGSLILLAYSVGLGLPFIAIGLAVGSAMPVISWLSRRANIVSVVSGILLIVVGIGLLTGTLPRLITFLTV